MGRGKTVTMSQWHGRTINGSLGLGALVFVASDERPLSRLPPEVNDFLTIAVNGEHRGYKIIAAADREMTIQSAELRMSLRAVPNGHPSHREAMSRQGGSVWAVRSIVL